MNRIVPKFGTFNLYCNLDHTMIYLSKIIGVNNCGYFYSNSVITNFVKYFLSQRQRKLDLLEKLQKICKMSLSLENVVEIYEIPKYISCCLLV